MGQAAVPAHGRYPDTELQGSIHHGGTGFHLQRFSVYLEFDHVVSFLLPHQPGKPAGRCRI